MTNQISNCFLPTPKYMPSRFNPSSLTAAEYAGQAVECAKRNQQNEHVFIDMLRFAWSLCYTQTMRLEDAAYSESALWC